MKIYALQKLNPAAGRYETISKPASLADLQAANLLCSTAHPEGKYRQIHLYKYGRQTICYIVVSVHCIEVRTGKPSAARCLSWNYPNTSDGLRCAQKTADEYLIHYVTPWKS